jgi:hypothetical protein
MKKILIILAVVIGYIPAQAQLSTLSNSKPLSYLNPAMQNYDIEKGVASFSVAVNPFVKEEVPPAYLGVVEFKANEDWRVGVNFSQEENRLSKSGSAMIYSSYRLELDKGNYLILGADIGAFSDVSKVAEYNKVLAPNKFSFSPDSSLVGTTTGLDFGLGVAYQYSGFTIGLGFSKLNNPDVYPSPVYIVEVDPTDSSKFQYIDTSIVIDRVNVGIQTNINMVYEWQASEKLTLLHSLHIANLDAAGADYIGLQNIAEINNRHSLGLGAFYNGNFGFNATAGVGITEDLKIQASAFLLPDLNYNSTLDIYEDDGYKPLIELNVRYEF